VGPWLVRTTFFSESGCHGSTERVAYGENQSLDVVGESFYHENISKIANGRPGKEAGWLPGFLVPEQLNEFDHNAVAVYVVHWSDKGIDALKVGHLPKGLAAKVQIKIVRLLVEKRKLVPLLIYLKGGTADFPNYGVIANARTDAINFDVSY